MKEKNRPNKSSEDDIMSAMQATAPWKARYRILTYEEAEAEIAAAKATKDNGNG